MLFGISNYGYGKAAWPVPMIPTKVGHKRPSTTEIYATMAPVLMKDSMMERGLGPR